MLSSRMRLGKGKYPLRQDGAYTLLQLGFHLVALPLSCIEWWPLDICAYEYTQIVLCILALPLAVSLGSWCLSGGKALSAQISLLLPRRGLILHFPPPAW